MRLAVAVVASLLVGAPALGAEADRCFATPEYLQLGAPLPRTAVALAQRGPLSIVAIGSSSTQGHGASTPAHAYPAQLERELRRLDDHVRIANLGAGGHVAAQSAARFATEVIPLHPALVIWQLGANDAIRGVDRAAFAATMDDGIGQLRAAGADVLLLPPQYAPRVLASANLADYLLAIDRAAARHGVPVFRRFDITRRNIEEGRIRFVDLFTGDDLHQNDLGYRCLAQQLARALRSARR